MLGSEIRLSLLRKCIVELSTEFCVLCQIARNIVSLPLRLFDVSIVDLLLGSFDVSIVDLLLGSFYVSTALREYV